MKIMIIFHQVLLFHLFGTDLEAWPHPQVYVEDSNGLGDGMLSPAIDVYAAGRMC
jgi:hypothetical protein